MRVTIIEPDATGGMTHFAYMLGRALNRAGCLVTLVTAHNYELRELPHEFDVREEFSLWARTDARRSTVGDGRGALSRVYQRVIRRTWRGMRLFLEMWRVAGPVAATSPDVILIRPFPVPGRSLLLRRLRRTRATLVEVSHEFEPRDTTQPLAARIESRLAGTASLLVDARLFLGDSLMERYSSLHRRFPPSRMFTIPHGDGELFQLLADPSFGPRDRYGISDEDEVVLFFGNLRPSKGVDDLVEAFARAERPAGSKLLIVGYPSRDFDVAALRRHIARDELGDAIVLDLGYIPIGAVGPLYDVCRFVALPYRSATQSGPLHVALSYHKPVLATRTGGIPDVIEDGVNGVLVDPGDIDALSRGLERLLWDDSLVTSLGQAMASQVADHSWPVVAKGVLGAVESVRSRRSM
jgi:glycosyltransferase involved in cell wall biosynthesis